APYGLGAEVLGLAPVTIGWLTAGLMVGILGGPGLLLLAMLVARSYKFAFRMQGVQVDCYFPHSNNGVQPRAAVAGMLFLLIGLGPCVEELLFRGVVYTGLRNELGVWVAVPLSALLFGLFHHDFGLLAVVFNSVMGVVYALLMEGSGSLWPAVLAH